MRIGKVMAGLLSSALVLTAVVGAPIATDAKSKKEKQEQEQGKYIDWGVINFDRLAKNLIDQGIIDEDATPEEIEREVAKYIEKRNIPHGIDTSNSFGQKAAKTKAKADAKASKKANQIDADKKSSKSRQNHNDNIVMALIEFPDLAHNTIPETPDALWTADFSQEHYEKMLFNSKEYTTPEGDTLTTMKQYYHDQSGGTWSVGGVVTPWITAQNNEEYYGGNDENDNDKAPRDLVLETLETVGQSIAGKESDYDKRDPYDIDGDGNVMEPDGMLDNLMLVHSGIGEETGERPNAIWSHRWTLKKPTAIPGTSLKAYDYMVQPEDGAVGVFAHEYGHNLGLPDLYDTTRQGLGSPVGSWSIMSSGSWNGVILGTEPTAFDPWSKLELQARFGGNWLAPEVIDYKDIKNAKKITLNEGASFGAEGKSLKITLPDVEAKPPVQPYEGNYSYFSDKGDDLNTKMTSPEIDLAGASSVTLSYDAWRQIEAGYDYLYLNIIDANSGDYLKKEFKVWDDVTEGWVKENIDLSEFAGNKIKLEFNYVTDGGLAPDGFYSDNYVVEADGNVVFEDNAEEPKFDLDGFIHFDGTGQMLPAYYLVEWRTQNGMDKGLANYNRNMTFFAYDPGLVVWYYDGRYGKTSDNHTGNHPGEGFIGVVDAHQDVRYWNGDPSQPAGDRYQVNDAAFGLKDTSGINIDFINGTLNYGSLPGVSEFYDRNDYSMPGAEDVGKILQQLGIRINVLKEMNGGKKVQFELSREND
ncbi:immune inhibitor A domain-containing protein [Brevibacillus sp. SYSU BS000544]|uniref:immune inhibitor A domain-containing protein n=1 Tax=Brevibacillus sp. SYSU BS000544 TaxID=3416443 RepID=UPI003CE49E67